MFTNRILVDALETLEVSIHKSIIIRSVISQCLSSKRRRTKK